MGNGKTTYKATYRAKTPNGISQELTVDLKTYDVDRIGSFFADALLKHGELFDMNISFVVCPVCNSCPSCGSGGSA